LDYWATLVKSIRVKAHNEANVWYNDSKMAKNTPLINPYNILSNDSNRHGYYFLKYQYFNT